MQSAGIRRYFEDSKRALNADIGRKHVFEVGYRWEFTMDLKNSICQFLEKNENRQTVIDQEKDLIATSLDDNGKGPNAFQQAAGLRDGMSDESARYQIIKCTNNPKYKIHGIKNRGRYYIASIQDGSGKTVNELMVDKLNGRVKFIR